MSRRVFTKVAALNVSAHHPVITGFGEGGKLAEPDLALLLLGREQADKYDVGAVERVTKDTPSDLLEVLSYEKKCSHVRDSKVVVSCPASIAPHLNRAVQSRRPECAGESARPALLG